MSYNLTFMDSTTNFLALAQGVNTASNNWLGACLLFVLAIGLYVAFKKEDSMKEFLISLFITSTVSVMMFLTNLLTFQVAIIIPTIFLILLVVYFMIDQG